MKYEDIHDRIDVIGLFCHGQIQPLKFKWRSHIYKIEHVNGEWTSRIGQTRFSHYAVKTSGPDMYEICFNHQTKNWELTRVCMVG